MQKISKIKSFNNFFCLVASIIIVTWIVCFKAQSASAQDTYVSKKLSFSKSSVWKAIKEIMKKKKNRSTKFSFVFFEDLDGDGIKEKIYWNEKGYVLTITNYFFKKGIIIHGLPGDIPFFVDLYGDGKAEINFYMPSTDCCRISCYNESWTSKDDIYYNETWSCPPQTWPYISKCRCERWIPNCFRRIRPWYDDK